MDTVTCPRHQVRTGTPPGATALGRVTGWWRTHDAAWASITFGFPAGPALGLAALSRLIAWRITVIAGRGWVAAGAPGVSSMTGTSSTAGATATAPATTASAAGAAVLAADGGEAPAAGPQQGERGSAAPMRSSMRTVALRTVMISSKNNCQSAPPSLE
jgi:hypothetical protein